MSDRDTSHVVWQRSVASVRGRSHADGDLPNQDSVFVATSDDGEVVCAVVSDGAGTAARSAEGSSLAARHIATALRDFGDSPDGRVASADQVRLEVERSIETVRDALSGEDAPLSCFHATCVIWLALPGAGYVAQIGDSVALATRFATVDDFTVDFFPDALHTLHEGERGEYCNETHFLTQADWRNHLRIAVLDADVDAVVLMTDGAMDVAMSCGRVFRGFLSALVGKLLTCDLPAERDRVVDAWFAAPQTHALTGDDKTLFMAIRRSRLGWAGQAIHLAPPAPIAAVERR